MHIHRCWFCSSPIYPGHGVLFVRNDCKEFRFCRGKCHKAFKKKRNPRKVRWTKIYRKTNNKELSDDLALTFEKKRDSLFKYDKETLLKTIHAMDRINEIRQKRESAFIKKRLYQGILNRKADDRKLVETSMHLIRAENARDYVAKKRKMETENNESDESHDEVDEMDVDLDEMEKKFSSVAKKTKKTSKKSLLEAK